MEVNCQCTAPIGINSETAFTAYRNRRFYLNTADPAPCNGTINTASTIQTTLIVIVSITQHLQFTEQLVQVIVLTT